MKDWLAEVLVVLAYSSRTQFAIVLGIVSFVGLMLAGDYFVGRIELHGALAPLTEVVREKLFHRYDKAAWASLAACLLLAANLYRKDRKRMLGLLDRSSPVEAGKPSAPPSHWLQFCSAVKGNRVIQLGYTDPNRARLARLSDFKKIFEAIVARN